jgi:HEAT repeat protein
MPRNAVVLSVAVVLALSDSAATAQRLDITGSEPWPLPLNVEVSSAENISLLALERADRKSRILQFRAVNYLKGRGSRTVCHDLPQLPQRDWDSILAWARPGKRAVCFERPGTAIVSLGNFWYRVSREPPELRIPAEACPEYGVTFVGNPLVLARHIQALQAGKEVVVTVQDRSFVWPGERSYSDRFDWVRGEKGFVARVRLAPSPPRDGETGLVPLSAPRFVGWGPGNDAVPGLLRRLKSPDEHVRAEAAIDLGLVGPDARGALVGLKKVMTDGDPFVRLYAAQAIGRIEPKRPAPLAKVLDALGHSNPEVRYRAAAVLASLGSRSRPGARSLLARLEDREERVRLQVAEALAEVGRDPETPPEARGHVAGALGAALIREPSAQVQLALVHAIEHQTGDAWVAVPALSRVLRSVESDVAELAAGVLARLDPPPLPVLIEAARDPRCLARRTIIEALGELGPEAELAAPILTRLLVDPGLLKKRMQLVRSLLRVGGPPAREAVLPVLGDVLRGPSEEQKAEALDLLNEENLNATAWRKELTPLLKARSVALRFDAAEALCRAGFADRAAPVLLQAADIANKNSDHRRWAVTALRRLGKQFPDAHAALVRLAKNPSDPMRPQILLALWHLRALDQCPPPLRSRVRAIEALNKMAQTWYFPFVPSHPERPAVIGLHSDRMEDLFRAMELAKQMQGRLLTDQKVITRLRADLRKDDCLERLVAALALCRLGHQEQALPVLIDLVTERPRFLWYAANTLEACGPRARAALPCLYAELTHPAPIPFALARQVGERIAPGSTRQVWGVYGWSGEKKKNSLHLSDAELLLLWATLADGDAAAAHVALCKLILSGESAVRFLGSRLRPVVAPSSERLTRLLVDLEDRRYLVRKQAFEELEALGGVAEPVLRSALTGHPSLELRRRVEDLLAGLGPLRSLTRLRQMRGVVVLEHIGTSGAKVLLKSLASGASRSRLTQEAKAALKRLAKR